MFHFLLVVIVHLFGLLVTFYSLCILCDEHLIPTVDVFIKQFELPEEVAAVTLVAFGSAAPELFLNSVSAVARTSDLSLSAILGSGMVAFGLIPPLCVLSSLRYDMKFRLFPILRECSFYLMGLSIFLICIQDGKIELMESVFILAVYLLYVSTVIYIYYKELAARKLAALAAKFSAVREHVQRNGGVITDEHLQHVEDFANADDETVSLLIVHSPNSSRESLALHQQVQSGDLEEDIESASIPSVESGVIERFFEMTNRCFSTPIREVLRNILPKLHPLQHASGVQDNLSQYVPLWRAVLCLAMSVLCISLLASTIVAISESLISNMSLDSATVGATLVAFGSEIPDTISSIALARSGYYDGALAGAIGSQVINISIGVGMPALFLALTSGRPLGVSLHEAQSLWTLACVLFFVICSYVSLTVPVVKIFQERLLPEVTIVSKSGATFQLCIWVLLYLTFIYLNERQNSIDHATNAAGLMDGSSGNATLSI